MTVLARNEGNGAQARAAYLADTRVEGPGWVGEIEAAELRLAGKSEIAIAMSAFEVICRQSCGDRAVAESQVAGARVSKSRGM